MKNFTSTPRTLSEAQFTTGYQSVFHTRRRRFNLWQWSGWIAFFLLLLVELARS